MSTYQKVIICGNVGQDPELRYTNNGAAIVNLSIATSRTYKTKDGEKQEDTEWHRVVFFDKLAEIIGEYVTKGSKLLIDGRLKTRKWADKDGIDRYTTEVVGENMTMLGGKSERGGRDEPRQEQRQRPAARPAPQRDREPGMDDESDIPF